MGACVNTKQNHERREESYTATKINKNKSVNNSGEELRTLIYGYFDTLDANADNELSLN